MTDSVYQNPIPKTSAPFAYMTEPDLSQTCQRCGACCATFCVSFYWSESNEHPSGFVPQGMTVPVTFHHLAMRGTDRLPPRCVALEGSVGQSVLCTIYEARPGPCHEFAVADERCNKARVAHGLPPL